MEQIRKAVELARAGGSAEPQVDDWVAPNPSRPGPSDNGFDPRHGLLPEAPPEPRRDLRIDQRSEKFREVMLNAAHLEANRIVSYDITDPRSKSFDMLRTQVLQAMDLEKVAGSRSHLTDGRLWKNRNIN